MSWNFLFPKIYSKCNYFSFRWEYKWESWCLFVGNLLSNQIYFIYLGCCLDGNFVGMQIFVFFFLHSIFLPSNMAWYLSFRFNLLRACIDIFHMENLTHFKIVFDLSMKNKMNGIGIEFTCSHSRSWFFFPPLSSLTRTEKLSHVLQCIEKWSVWTNFNYISPYESFKKLYIFSF